MAHITIPTEFIPWLGSIVTGGNRKSRTENSDLRHHAPMIEMMSHDLNTISFEIDAKERRLLLSVGQLDVKCKMFCTIYKIELT